MIIEKSLVFLEQNCKNKHKNIYHKFTINLEQFMNEPVFRLII